jgi:hypothetical protein
MIMHKLFLIIIIALLGMSLVTYGQVSVTTSSNEDLYACNAGILHAGQALRGTDYIHVQYEDTTVAVDHPAHLRGGNLESEPTSTTYQTLFASNLIWFRRITNLNFSFSTEKTGASYFVDFCYLGPIEDKKSNGNGNGNANGKKDLSEGRYNLISSLSSTNLDGETIYRDQVKLQAKVDVICDLRQKGALIAPRLLAETTPLLPETDISSYNDFYVISTSGLASEQNLNQSSIQVPRFCIIRASFAESQITTRSFNSANTEMAIYLDIQKAAE